MASQEQPKPATRSSKRNKRPSSPVLEFLSNARKKRGGSVKDSSTKDSGKPPKTLPATTTCTPTVTSPSIVTSPPTVTSGPTITSSPTVSSPPAVTSTSVTVTATNTITTPPESCITSLTSSPLTATTATPSVSTSATIASKERSLKQFMFKSPDFTHQSRSHSTKKVKSWKSLKQILTTQRHSANQDHVKYGTIDAPPSFKPAKKYSDISGFEAKYTDPQTKLRYSNTQEFAQVRILPTETVMGLLSLRKANQEVS